ncbi:CopG family transcriptional regulator [Corynebacterium poyangense]
MTLRLSTEEDRALNLLSRVRGCSKHEAAKFAIISTAAQVVDDAHIRDLARSTIREYQENWEKIHGSET